MQSPLSLASRTFPARIADLGFSAELPADWVSHELPQENADFSDPTAFVPLAVVTAPHAALIFAFVARPAYDDGTLHDWAWYLLKHNKLQPRTVSRGQIAGVAAIVGEAAQESELGPMVIRFAFFEDGNRLVNITLAAPELLADAVRDAWPAMLRSFCLETPRGSRFPIEKHPDDTPAAPIPEPWLEKAPSEDEPAFPEASPSAAVAHAPDLPEMEMSVPENLHPRKCRFHDFALTADAGSLDPENAINANLRDRGVGLVPNVASLHTEARRATLAAGAIEAHIDVPFGWHVIDDGQRTLVFEPSGRVQVNLDLIPRDDRDDDTILDAIESDARDAYPAPKFSRRTDGVIRTLAIRGIADGDQSIEQHHLLRPGHNDTRVVRARITATPEESADAWILGTLILESCVFAPTPIEETATADEPIDEPAQGAADSSRHDHPTPEWWRRALELEAQDQLDAAEKTIRDGCQHMGFAASTAEMYRLRMNRLKAAGDRAGARDAFKRSSGFISYYASTATSGGEGAALSNERDEFRARLVDELGCDPEARCA